MKISGIILKAAAVTVGTAVMVSAGIMLSCKMIKECLSCPMEAMSDDEAERLERKIKLGKR